MLINQQFIDPSIASEIKKLQEQMKQLIQTKINIENNQKIDNKRKQKLLKYNQDERFKLRKIIQKAKLSMVQYLDKQVQVVSKDCIMNGQLVGRNNKFLIEDKLCSNNDDQYKNLKVTQKDISISTQSSSFINKNNKCFSNRSNLSYQSISQSVGQNVSAINQSVIQKDRKSIASTHYRTNSRHSIKIQSQQSQLLLSKYGKNCNNNECHSEIMEIGEFSIRTDKMKMFNNNVYKQDENQFFKEQQPDMVYESNRQKLKVRRFLQNQQQQQLQYVYQQQQEKQQKEEQQQKQQQFLMVKQLYNRKIDCLEQKCHKLEEQNRQLRKIINYQQQTIQQISQIIQQKETQLKQIQLANKKTTILYQTKITKLQTLISYVLDQLKCKLPTVVDNHRNRINNCINDSKAIQLSQLSIIDTNKLYQSIINKYSLTQLQNKLNHSSLQQLKTIYHLPQSTQPIQQLNEESEIIPFQYPPSQYTFQHQFSSSQSIYNNFNPKEIHIKNNTDLLQLSQKLIQMQKMLKKIQSQNQQLRAERSLLLKKIKITV